MNLDAIRAVLTEMRATYAPSGGQAKQWADRLEAALTGADGADPLQAIRDAKYLNPDCAVNGCQFLLADKESICPSCTRPIRAGVEHCPWCKHYLGKLIAARRDPEREPR